MIYNDLKTIVDTLENKRNIIQENASIKDNIGICSIPYVIVLLLFLNLIFTNILLIFGMAFLVTIITMVIIIEINEKIIKKDSELISTIFKENQKEILIYLNQNIPQSMKETFNDFKVNIMKENYLEAIENIKKLMEKIETTTERERIIKECDDLIQINKNTQGEEQLNYKL